MKLLAIDTSSQACSIALFDGDKVHSQHQIAPMQQAQLILSMIETLLQSAGVELKQLDALAFGCGPGSFTGVRIATSVIQGLAFAMDIPVIPVSSLAALAQSAYQDLGWQKLLVGVDARMQEVYWAAYQVNASGLVDLVGKEMVCAPQQVVIPAGEGWCGVGNAWEVYHDELPVKPAQQDALRVPAATAILQLATEKYKKKDWVSPADAMPIYLRDTVAFKKNKPM
jgi:tRNA threonylcarbamoyladenosine biosynthesis protein TsaB